MPELIAQLVGIYISLLCFVFCRLSFGFCFQFNQKESDEAFASVGGFGGLKVTVGDIG